MTTNSPFGSLLSDDERTAIAQLGYEQARDELIAIVQQLEAGSPSLEKSLALWERGELLAQRCQEWLDGARQRLNEVQNKSQNTENTQ